MAGIELLRWTGLTTSVLKRRDLESMRCVLSECFRWRVVGERPEYSAVFVLGVQL